MATKAELQAQIATLQIDRDKLKIALEKAIEACEGAELDTPTIRGIVAGVKQLDDDHTREVTALETEVERLEAKLGEDTDEVIELRERVTALEASLRRAVAGEVAPRWCDVCATFDRHAADCPARPPVAKVKKPEAATGSVSAEVRKAILPLAALVKQWRAEFETNNLLGDATLITAEELATLKTIGAKIWEITR